MDDYDCYGVHLKIEGEGIKINSNSVVTLPYWT